MYTICMGGVNTWHLARPRSIITVLLLFYSLCHAKAKFSICNIISSRGHMRVFIETPSSTCMHRTMLVFLSIKANVVTKIANTIG